MGIPALVAISALAGAGLGWLLARRDRGRVLGLVIAALTVTAGVLILVGARSEAWIGLGYVAMTVVFVLPAILGLFVGAGIDRLTRR